MEGIYNAGIPLIEFSAEDIQKEYEKIKRPACSVLEKRKQKQIGGLKPY
jgi:hypothetical protein